MSCNILIIDDEKDMLILLSRIINEGTNHQVVTSTDPLQALELFREQDFDLVLTDLKMPKMDGIKLLKQLKKTKPEISVVVFTAYATIETAVTAIQEGAFDYLTKPFRRERIIMTIEKALKWRDMVNENLFLKKALAEQGNLRDIIGSTPVMKEVFERVRQVAPTNSTVMITGGSGTGKELIARAIHHNSRRSNKKYIILNCTAIPEHVLESELFGHVKGAFTGAWKDKKGLVEEVDEGTLFLDEIGDLDFQMQTKLLRLIQEGEYRPVGSTITKRTDIRFIAATNHDLKRDIAENRFREDLYYRLNVINIDLPSLKDRKEDIPILSYYFMKKYAHLNQKEIFDIAPSAMYFLLEYDFPGNIRELQNIIERGVIFARTKTITCEDLFPDGKKEEKSSIESENNGCIPFKKARKKAMHQFHSSYVDYVLRKSGGNISKAAEMAGIKRQYLHRLMKEASLEAADFKVCEQV